MFRYFVAAPYRLVFRATALTLRAGLHAQPRIYCIWGTA
jgi:hypothetical protein